MVRYGYRFERFTTGTVPVTNPILGQFRRGQSRSALRVSFHSLLESPPFAPAKPHDCTNFEVDHATHSVATAEVVLSSNHEGVSESSADKNLATTEYLVPESTL